MHRLICRQELKFLFFPCLALWVWGHAQAAGPITFYTEEYPPYNFINDQGKMDGISTRLLQEALTAIDHPVNFLLVPWARAFSEARLRPGNCMYSTARTAEREAMFHWVGPLVETEWAAFALPGRSIGATSLEELKGLRVGSFHEDAISIYVANQGVEIINASRDSENLKRLTSGLIDVWVTGPDVAEVVAGSAGVRLERLFTFRRSAIYLACHKSIPARFLEQLQTRVDRLKEEGRYHQIRQQVLGNGE
ncbi:substrate-binding periplasmic protein [Marinobacter panjinensis]|nr:ABC transporter substrate-binding protein [Marinobacter panjinensis]